METKILSAPVFVSLVRLERILLDEDVRALDILGTRVAEICDPAAGSAEETYHEDCRTRIYHEHHYKQPETADTHLYDAVIHE